MNKTEKEALRNQFKDYKAETLYNNEKLINKYKEEYELNSQMECDLINGNIHIEICETKEQKQKWLAFVHMTTSLPYKGAVGRQIKLFIKCGDHILGMVHLTSPLAQLRVRDEYLNFKDKWQELKSIYNIETCVCTPKYRDYLTGKLLIYCIFSNEIKEYLEEKYGDKLIGFETTSLYGKSSIYNRIPFLKYLGLTDGLSAVYLKDEEWQQIYKEYKEVFPNTKTNRLAPVKFQIVDKLSTWYKQQGKIFPYQYKSQSFKRGVYFGYKRDIDLSDAVNEWRERWLYKRIIYLKNTQQND